VSFFVLCFEYRLRKMEAMMVDYHALSRKELQALCKQHKIPANKTNLFMADSLAALLGVSTPPGDPLPCFALAAWFMF
jgi:hypothetical protein